MAPSSPPPRPQTSKNRSAPLKKVTARAKKKQNKKKTKKKPKKQKKQKKNRKILKRHILLYTPGQISFKLHS